jgi:Putative beta-barrel porin 2
MKKIAASVGLVALGASGLYSAPIAGLTEEGGKNWSVSATLRGFYDDNLNTTSGGNKQDTFGIEISPSVAVGFQWPQTTLSLGYVFSFKYYDHRPTDSSTKYDQSHIFNASVDHSFTERYHLSARESFVIGQEPDILRTGNAMETFQRISGDNIRNDAIINFDATLTRLFGFEVGYENAFWDYSQDGGDAASPSASGTLDRVENSVHLDSRWMICPETVGIFGYRFRDVSYTGDEEIGLTTGLVPIMSDNRNFRQHSIYVGAEQTFRPDLTGAARVGASYLDYYNDITDTGNNWAPYAMANLRYTYQPDSFVEVGLSQDVNATDVAQTTSGDKFTQSAESTVVYGRVVHHITPQLAGTEKDYLIGVNLSYRFTPHLSTEIGYNYDKLESDFSGSFDRNRVYIGVTGSY